MIGKKTLVNGRELAGKQCTYCEGRVIREQIREQFHVLYIALFTVSTKHRTFCKSCQRTLAHSEIATKPSGAIRKTRRQDGLLKTTKTEQKLGYEKITTRWDDKNQLPPTQEPELVATTIVAIMAYLEKVDPMIQTNGHENYEYIRESYSLYKEALDKVVTNVQAQSQEEGLATVVKLFEEAREKLLDRDLHFIVDQSLSLTSHQLFLLPEVDDLFRSFFLKIGYGEVEVERGINNSRVKWMSNQER